MRGRQSGGLIVPRNGFRVEGGENEKGLMADDGWWLVDGTEKERAPWRRIATRFGLADRGVARSAPWPFRCRVWRWMRALGCNNHLARQPHAGHGGPGLRHACEPVARRDHHGLAAIAGYSFPVRERRKGWRGTRATFLGRVHNPACFSGFIGCSPVIYRRAAPSDHLPVPRVRHPGASRRLRSLTSKNGGRGHPAPALRL